MDGYVTIGTDLDTKSFDAQIDYVKGQLEDIEDKLRQADMGFEVGDVQKLEAQYEKLTDKLRTLVQKKEEMNKTDFSGIKKSIDNVGNSVQKVTKKVGKWALAVFGIRSAFMFVRNAINTIANDDDQLAADIQYMKDILAYTLEPIVRSIVNLAKQLMFYVAYITKAWTGKNVFENANKSLKNANKQAKQLSKTMAGFDEMNILNDNGSVSSTGGASFDLGNIEDMPVPAWVDWIAKNGDIVIAIIGGIATALISMKLLGLDPIMALGIGAIITGIILLIQDVINFINDPSWEGFANILRDLAIILAGVAVAMLAVNAANPIAWIMLAIAAVVALAAAVITHWEEIKNVLGTVGSWIYNNIIKPIGDFFAGLWNGIVTGLTIAVNTIKNVFNGLVSFFKSIISTIVGIFQTIGSKVGNVFNSLKSVVLAPINSLISGINTLIKGLNKISFDVPDWIPLIGGKKWGFNIPQIPKLAKGGIVNLPGKGVPIGGALTGEQRPEGVIPLTDSQQMSLLGEAIGRYITVNANITNTMNGRVISRELQRVQNDSDFAYNR